ncbi:exported hypothetical protein [Agrobacterium deltaense NCPPB 1641]|uniref:Uncharacterized protein n=1 Tax=Agrobacterium deltaense NCPPB 1641 TaxID=1183425 RepID=A0A1S7UAT5_9HYPH|nr:exported hypothetical protein [Agrobacterium deltaense NCPPB 1641]
MKDRLIVAMTLLSAYSILHSHVVDNAANIAGYAELEKESRLETAQHPCRNSPIAYS